MEWNRAEAIIIHECVAAKAPIAPATLKITKRTQMVEITKRTHERGRGELKNVEITERTQLCRPGTLGVSAYSSFGRWGTM